MAERMPAALEEKFRKRLAFYQDIGIELFYRDRIPRQNASITEEITLPKSVKKTEPVKLTRATPLPATKNDLPPAALGVSLFDSMNRIAGDSLPRILGDIGECTRCKLHRGRTKLVLLGGIGTRTGDAERSFSGLIRYLADRGGYDQRRAYDHIAQIGSTIERIFARAEAEKLPPSVVADRLAEERVRHANETR